MNCPKCGKESPENGAFCSSCGAPLGKRTVSDSAPCPKCGGTNADKSGYTWWGGFLGPKLFNHVKCRACGTGYNAKTGKSNTRNIAIYQGIALVVTVVILCLGFLYIWR